MASLFLLWISSAQAQESPPEPEVPPASIPQETTTTPEPAPPDAVVWKVDKYVILTLRGPDSSERLARIQARFEDTIRRAPQPKLTVEVTGNDGGAFVVVNGRGMIDVTPRDAQANGTRRVLPVAQQWASRLRAVVANPAVLHSLFVLSGLPEQIVLGTTEYGRGSGAAPDNGRFTTDGTRSAPFEGKSWIVYWDALGTQPYQTVFLLNRFREFIPYPRQDTATR
jgi:hypothetical protein